MVCAKNVFNETKVYQRFYGPALQDSLGIATSVTVTEVTTAVMTYNGKQVPAKTVESSRAIVIVGDYNESGDSSYNEYN